MKENKRMNLLTMEHITKAYTDRVLLNDVAFSINENEKIGVIGINGMGKSTLLKVTAGIEPYDEGKISMSAGVSSALTSAILFFCPPDICSTFSS